ncbi:MAG: phosphoglucomutase/phosphomannomutase family protein [Thermoanaerobaculia bacterium]|nr:phosphoglucomutase/phosphomannomutase family protein [Acidobacteriota bacterium]
MSFPLGTDGWRGVIAEGCTFAAIERLSAATAEVYRSLPEGDTSRIVVGHDTRFFSPEFARRAADTLAAAGLEVLLTDRPIPTPAVSDHVGHLGLAGGVAITASHNPGAYNGFKIKSHFGGSAPPQLYDAVARAADALRPAPAARAGTVRVEDLLSPYRERLGALVNLPAMRGAGLAVLADSMHGAAGSLVPDILSGGKTRVAAFRAERDPLFGGVHPEPIASNLAAAAERVRAEGLDLAVAQDGDADRLGVLDARGRFVSPHRILALLLLHAYRRRRLTGGIAKTFSTSLLIDRVAESLGAPLHETPIGFKYVADLMNRGEAAAGGEESGGYAFSFHLPERDGVLNALLLIESLALSGRDLDGALADLAAEFGEFAYGRRDVYLPVPVITAFLTSVRQEPPAEVAGHPVTGLGDKDGVKYAFGSRGWLLHRLSGTEPMIRLYCEHEDEASVDRILEAARTRLEKFASLAGARPSA